MPRPKGLLMRYLGAVGEVLDRLTWGGRASLAPTTSLFLLVLFSTSTAFTSPFPLCLTTAIPFVLSASLAVLSRKARDVVKVVAVASAHLTIISTPLLFITEGEQIASLDLGFADLSITWEGLWTALEFFLRCLGAISVAVSWMAYAGFQNILQGLRAIDPGGTITSMAFLTVRYIPLAIRESQRLVAAREARLMVKRSLRASWLVLASCCGDLFLRCFNRAWKVGLALKARSLSGDVVPKLSTGATRPGAPDVLWACLACAYVVLLVLKVV